MGIIESIGSEHVRNVLADYAHKAWAGWMQYLFEKSELQADGTLVIPKWAVDRWKRQIATRYCDLPAEEQASDLVEADKIIARVEAARADS